MGIFTPSSDTSRRGQCVRCNSGLDELEHAAFQVEIYSGGRGGWGDRQPASGSKLQTGEGGAAVARGVTGAACLSTFSV